MAMITRVCRVIRQEGLGDLLITRITPSMRWPGCECAGSRARSDPLILCIVIAVAPADPIWLERSARGERETGRRGHVRRPGPPRPPPGPRRHRLRPDRRASRARSSVPAALLHSRRIQISGSGAGSVTSPGPDLAAAADRSSRDRRPATAVPRRACASPAAPVCRQPDWLPRATDSRIGRAAGSARECRSRNRLRDDRRSDGCRRDLGVPCLELGVPAGERMPQRDPCPAAKEQHHQRDVQSEPAHHLPPLQSPSRRLWRRACQRGLASRLRHD